MRLVSITAKNFRTLQDLKLSFAKSYCTISGKNNAGKSSVIRLLSILFGFRGVLAWSTRAFEFSYKEDKTQWVKNSEAIEIKYLLHLEKDDDPALISFIETMASKTASSSVLPISIHYTVSDTDEVKISVEFDGAPVDDRAAKEINKKIKDSNLVFLYNSTRKQEEVIFGLSGRHLLYDFVMSEQDKKKVQEAGRQVQKRIRLLAKQHKQALDSILGRLADRYDIEFSPIENLGAGHMPVGINLKDKNVEVPLDNWGSGTQNRTQIMMLILQASRIKTTASADDRTTPIVLIEEPESFLHPSAQAEFGNMLRALSEEFGVQLLATTHSPYMLNREIPTSNILLHRRVHRGKAYETLLKETTGEEWMAPFAEHLGIDPNEFQNWKPFFSAVKSKVLLVEGMVDEEYFNALKGLEDKSDALLPEIEVKAYGGKDTLKNTVLCHFVLSNFDRVFLTYDLDAHDDVEHALKRLGLRQGENYLALGTPKPGKDCIEGLLPDRVLSAVNGRETDLVMRLTSPERKHAKDKLKKLYLEEFKKHSDYTSDELRALTRVTRAINSRFQKDS